MGVTPAVDAAAGRSTNSWRRALRPARRRIPEFLVPALVYGMVGVLYIRFSPLWGPASEALAVALQYRAKVGEGRGMGWGGKGWWVRAGGGVGRVGGRGQGWGT